MPPRRSTFCSASCVHELKLRSDPGYVRRLVLRRDLGICSACGIDCAKLERLVSILYYHHGGGNAWAVIKQVGYHEGSALTDMLLRDLGFGPTGYTSALWQADHIVPVCEGGGFCGLEGYRTLCSVCHKQATKDLAGRRAKRKRQC